MSSHPNTYIAIEVSGLSNELLEKIQDDNEIQTDDIYVSVVFDENNEHGIPVSGEGVVVLFKHVTYGYGDIVSITNLLKEADEFIGTVRNFCNEHKCTQGELFIGADFW